MKIENTPLKDCFIIHDTVHGDARGYFIETFNQKDFAAATGLDIVFVQDNQSRSSKGVLRGLHMQKGDAAQAKLVRVIEGAVLDIAVDLRKESLQIELDARKAILDRYPTSAVAHHNYAHALKRGVFENNTPDTRVFKLFTQAVELDPTNPTLWISLANNMPCYVEEVALKLENSDTAVHLNRHQCYQRALELDPDNQD